jgi:4-diphosphocytidyl-2-C-methyl-D-erythritol kinase
MCPLIDPALQALRDSGAQDALVSGSGPTVFGVFADEEAAGRAARRLHPDYPRATSVGAYEP